MQTLLLVDADPVNRCVLEVHLRKEGYHVTVAADGAEALEAIENVDSASPEVVVTDTQLPGLDGFELVRRIRTTGGLHDPSVVFLAANGSPDDRRRALDLGVEDYLTKPVYMRELSARIQFLLAKRTRRAMEERALSGGGGLARPVGSTHDLALVDILRNFESSRQSGVVRLRNGMHEAHIFFRDGNVVDADLGPLRGEAAIHRALLWDEASFEVEFKPVRNEDAIGRSTQAVVVAGMRRIDEWVRLCAQVKPLAALLDVPPPQLLERLHDLTDVPEGLKALVPTSSWAEAGAATTAKRLAPERDEATGAAPVARAQPVAPAEPAAGAQPVAPAESAARAQPVAAAEPVAPAEPLARAQPVASAQPVVRAEAANALPLLEADATPSLPRIPSQRPSAAPWTREVDPVSDYFADTVAAGVPRALDATTKRVAATGLTVALVLGAVVGLRSLRAHQLQESEAARSGSAATVAGIEPSGAAAAALPGEPAIPSPPDEPIASASAPAAEPSMGVLSVTAAAEPLAPTITSVNLAAVPAADVRARGQEKALDVRFVFHSSSPLVRDAQRALLKGDTEAATSLAQKAVSGSPADADAWLTLAAARKAAGDLAGAGDAYRGCVEQAQTAGVMNCRAMGVQK